MRSALAAASAALACAVASPGEGPTVIPIPNGGFEDGAREWRIPMGGGISSVTTERAASGRYSLKVKDADGKRGSNVTAALVPVEGAGAYELRGKVYPVSGSGLGMYVRILDSNRKVLNSDESHLRGLGGTDRKWRSFELPFYTPADAAFLELWIHSYSAAKVEACLDDLEFVMLTERDAGRPWEPKYKIKPEEKDRLTPADVVGPDGIVYPDWTRTGVQGGIPGVKPFARAEKSGARADDGGDDSAALQRAVDAAGEKGGGAVVLGEGTYHLDRPVTVRHSGVVIRGRGAERTKIIFRYAVPPGEVKFYWPLPGARVGRNTRLEMHCHPKGLAKMTMAVDDRVLGTWSRGQHSGNTFSYARRGWDVAGKLPDGRHTLKGVAEYGDGRKVTGSVPIVLDGGYDDPTPAPDSAAAITFAGRGWSGPRMRLAEDGLRGATSLRLEKTEGLRPGDRIVIDGPATERWKRLTRNKCRWGAYRRYLVQVESVKGDVVALSQPLRIDFPKVDGSYVQKVEPIERCGIEDLYIEQTENLWISSVLFSQAWNSWARGVTVKKCGRFPVYGKMAKWCEFRDCVFDDAHFKGGGGTAYAGWEYSYDCLMEDVETFKLRHGPLFQWSASGCVIRKSTFHESDGQWHSGWTNENLMEQCVIRSVRGHGGYGFGLWASPPEDTAHGPNGPRNVVYHCDIYSERDGLWMGGMNECWLVLHNRFVVEKGRGVFAKTASFDHIIKNNVFVLRDKKSPMVYLATPDCVGVELAGNKLYGGNGEFASGAGKPLVAEGNVARPLADAPSPRPAVPSIYEWQNARR